MPIPTNPAALTIAQLCSSLQGSTMGEAAAMIDELRRLFQLPLHVVLQGYGTEAGVVTDASAFPPGSPITIVGGVDGAGNAQQILTGTDGSIAAMPGVADNGGFRSFLCDRTGILSVAPPVSKLWVQSQQNTGALTPSATSAAAGAGLRNIILALGITVACGATAMPATLPSLSGVPTAPVWPIACPVNDSRHVLVQGPFIGNANASNVLTGPLGVVGSFQSVWMVGYVASFP